MSCRHGDKVWCRMGIESGAQGLAAPARPGFCGCFSQTVVPTVTPLSSPAKPPAAAGTRGQDVESAPSRNDAAALPPVSAAQPGPLPSTSGRPGAASLSAEDACLRWAVNSARWDPVTNGEEWLFLLDLLPEEEQRQVRLSWHRHPALTQRPRSEHHGARCCPRN